MRKNTKKRRQKQKKHQKPHTRTSKKGKRFFAGRGWNPWSKERKDKMERQKREAIEHAKERDWEFEARGVRVRTDAPDK